MAWKVNDTVAHTRDGVCRVVGIEDLTLASDEPCSYFILRPVYEPGSKLYVPVDRADELLRDLITREEIGELIDMMPEIGFDWISDEKSRQRALQQDIRSGSHEVLLGIITTLYRKREEIGSSGRKFHSSDEHFLNEAEKQINREFGYVLGIDPGKVPDYIIARVKKA